MAVISASFHSLGRVPFSIDLLNKIAKGPASSSDNSFKARGYSLSGPGDLFGLRLFSFSFTCSSFITRLDTDLPFDLSPANICGILV